VFPDGLLERAQHEQRQRLRAGLVGDLVEHCLHPERRRGRFDIDRDPVRLEELGELLDALALRRGVGRAHTVIASRFLKKAPDRLVRGDHVFLDQLVGPA
jgi:hypothetical protein